MHKQRSLTGVQVGHSSVVGLKVGHGLFGLYVGHPVLGGYVGDGDLVGDLVVVEGLLEEVGA